MYPSGGSYPVQPSYSYNNYDPSQQPPYAPYPPSQPGGGYPPASNSGYPPASNSGYPGGSGYPQMPQPSYGSSGGYPGSSGGYPSGGGNYPPYPSQGGYAPPPPQQPSYDPYPPSSAGGLYPNISAYNDPYAAAAQPAPQYGGYDNPPPRPQPTSSYPTGGGYPPYGHHAGGGFGGALPPPPPAHQAQYMYQGTVHAAMPFNAHDDATRLYKAMKGFGTDETTLIDVLCRRTANQRQEIALAFKTGYGKELVKNLESETSGNFRRVLKQLMRTKIQVEAHDLKKSIEGFGTNEKALIDVVCTKSNMEMAELKAVYRQLYGRDAEKDCAGDVSGYFRRLIVSLMAARRSDFGPDHQKAAQQAQEIYQAGMGRIGTDEVTFNRIFASESFPHLKVVFEEYYKQTGQDIEKAIRSEMSGDIERAFLCIVDMARDPPAYWAKRLYESMKGAGTNEETLIRVMVTRCEIDMVQIKQNFQARYGQSLEAFIRSDVSGDFKRSLLCLAGDPNWKS